MGKIRLAAIWLVAHLQTMLLGQSVKRGTILGANTLTSLIPTLYESLDVVSRELIGLTNAVTRNSTVERAAINQTVTYPVVPAITTGNVTPGVTAPNDGDATIGNNTMAITKAKYAPVRWNGEEQRGLAFSGQGNNIIRDQFAQAMRTLVNEVEADLAALYIYASRSVGTGGVDPFGTAADLTDFANARRELEENGASQVDLQMVLGSGAITNIRGKQSVLFKANEAGTTELLRQGTIGMVEGLSLHNTPQVKRHVKGTGALATTNNAGYAIGATVITLASAGTGTIIVGDSIAFAGDANQYVVVAGDTDVSDGGTVTIAAPGLRAAIPAAATAITVQGTGERNMVFARSAIHLVTRSPAMPSGGDMADDVTEVQDPYSGLGFQVALYRQYRQIRYEIALAWGMKVVKPEHFVLLLGA